MASGSPNRFHRRGNLAVREEYDGMRLFPIFYGSGRGQARYAPPGYGKMDAQPSRVTAAASIVLTTITGASEIRV